MGVFERILDFLLSAIPLGMCFLLGSTGEILTEKAGHLNLGIPGIMCVGSAGGCLALHALADSPLPVGCKVVLAILMSFVAGGLMGLLYSFLTVTLHANQNVTGLALTTFGVGVMKYVFSTMARSSEGARYLYALRGFRFPFADTRFKYCGVLFFLAILIAVIASFVLTRTKIGLNLRAVGENPATADAVGINVTAYRYVATVVGSGIAGLGGIYHIMDYSGSQEAYLSIEAMGWLAIALVIFSLWKPYVSIFGSAIFGALYVAGSYIPGIQELHVTMRAAPLLEMLPYVFTILVLLVTSARKNRNSQPPQSLGLNYFREDR